jgi:hypothetical protein
MLNALTAIEITGFLAMNSEKCCKDEEPYKKCVILAKYVR